MVKRCKESLNLIEILIEIYLLPTQVLFCDPEVMGNLTIAIVFWFFRRLFEVTIQVYIFEIHSFTLGLRG